MSLINILDRFQSDIIYKIKYAFHFLYRNYGGVMPMKLFGLIVLMYLILDIRIERCSGK